MSNFTWIPFYKELAKEYAVKELDNQDFFRSKKY